MKLKPLTYLEAPDVKKYIKSVTDPRSADNNASQWIRRATKEKMLYETKKLPKRNTPKAPQE